MSVQEKGRLIIEEGEKVNLINFRKKMKDQAKGKGKVRVCPSINKESKCFFL